MECVRFSADQHWSEWEAAATQLQQADRYCSSPYWGVPLLAAFAMEARPMVYRLGRSLAIFHEVDVEGVHLHLPCDFCWTLGNPLLGPDPRGMFEALCEFWQAQGGVHQVTLSGLYPDHPVWGSALWRRLPHWELAPAGRHVASLEGGAEGFLARRSANFRSRLKRTVKKAEEQEIEVEFFPHQPDLATTLSLWQRVLKVEAQSWKGLRGQGIDSGSMASFYRHMLPALARNGRLRGLFLRREGQDLSYLFGAVFADYFRGLQFSYLQSCSESLGNIGQWNMIKELAAQGCRSYDLGQAMAYKSRWAEQKVTSLTRGLEINSQGFNPER